MSEGNINPFDIATLPELHEAWEIGFASGYEAGYDDSVLDSELAYTNGWDDGYEAGHNDAAEADEDTQG